MKNVLTLLAGFGAGATLMYLLDPQGGRRRRALIRDKAVSVTNQTKDTVDKKARDLSNRAQGLMHEAKSLVSGNGENARETEPGQTL